MKVFLTWSGSLSKKVAMVLRDWIPTVIPSATPWISSENIDKGARWAVELARQLEETSFGIICVVPGNQNAPWLNFEAGALSKSFGESRISPFLIGLESNQIPSTISQFQCTVYDEEDLLRLAHSINKSMASNNVTEKQIERSFRVCWPGPSCPHNVVNYYNS